MPVDESAVILIQVKIKKTDVHNLVKISSVMIAAFFLGVLSINLAYSAPIPTTYPKPDTELLGLKTGMTKDEVIAVIGEPFTPGGAGLDIQYDGDIWFNIEPDEDNEAHSKYHPPDYILYFVEDKLAEVQLWLDSIEEGYNGIHDGASEATVIARYGTPSAVYVRSSKTINENRNIDYEYSRHNVYFSFDKDGAYSVTYYDPARAYDSKKEDFSIEIQLSSKESKFDPRPMWIFSHDKWIAVEDGLPKPYDSVLLAIPFQPNNDLNFRYYFHLGYVDSDGKWHANGSETKPSHWNLLLFPQNPFSY